MAVQTTHLYSVVFPMNSKWNPQGLNKPVQMSLDTKRAEIKKLEERARQREEALKKSEQVMQHLCSHRLPCSFVLVRVARILCGRFKC
jgi:predicted Holliday junction resolvase-like endonuclease